MKVRQVTKRVMDLAVAGIACVALSPILLLVATAILLKDGRPILFRQQRPGLDGTPFTIVKFRTMRAPRPGETWYLTDKERMTRLGRLLRSTSIDELPELWNVMRGEMSLVGPRPLLMDYLAAYTPDQRRRQSVRPGMTSWAIVNGRHALTFTERLELDTWYVDHWTLRLDLRILLLTLGQLVRHRDVATAQDVSAIGFPLPGAVSDEVAEPGDAGGTGRQESGI